ncbi:penicillin-binding protein 1A, partial [Candidatus Hakubella thermalkaliphila]
MAYQLEKEYSKEEILELYLNTVYFGAGAYGIQTAAETYFNKNAEELSLGESALLAGLIRSPAKYDPYLDEDAAISRRNLVLQKMVELGYITAEEGQRAVESPLHLERPTIKTYDVAPHFVEHVRRWLMEEWGANAVYRGGLKIYTTLDPKLQVMAEQAIAEFLPEPEDPWAAVVAMDPKTGHILAMVGGRDRSEQYNLVTQGQRQPDGEAAVVSPPYEYNLVTQGQRQQGSVPKVFVLAAALEAGYHPLLTFPPNGPLTFEMPVKDWEVDNYGGTSYNTPEMTIVEGTARSVNVVYAQLVMHLGAEKVIEVAKKMGVTSPWEPHPSVALGALDISPLEVAVAFSTLANYGVRNEPTAILKVVDRDGQVLYEHRPQSAQAISAINAYRVTEVLKGVIQHGTGGRANIGRPAAGKTGTSQEEADAWFAGYTPDLTTVVWIGYPEERRRMGVIRGTRVQGGSFPAMIWRTFMAGALQDRPATDFVKPQEDVIPVLVDKENSKLINRFTPPEEMELRHYRYGGEPVEQSERFMEKKTLPDVVGMPWEQANHLL